MGVGLILFIFQMDRQVWLTESSDYGKISITFFSDLLLFLC